MLLNYEVSGKHPASRVPFVTMTCPTIKRIVGRIAIANFLGDLTIVHQHPTLMTNLEREWVMSEVLRDKWGAFQERLEEMRGYL